MRTRPATPGRVGRAQAERGRTRLQFLLKQAEVFQHFAPVAADKEKKKCAPARPPALPPAACPLWLGAPAWAQSRLDQQSSRVRRATIQVMVPGGERCGRGCRPRDSIRSDERGALELAEGMEHAPHDMKLLQVAATDTFFTTCRGRGRHGT